MAYPKLSLPEAYLEPQIENKLSFFVYQNELASLKRVEARIELGSIQLGCDNVEW